MQDDRVDDILEALVEELAAIEHTRWAHWQRHVHALGEQRPDGSLLLPADQVRRWERQMRLDYADLDDAEKHSDRAQVRRYLPRIAAALKDAAWQ